MRKGFTRYKCPCYYDWTEEDELEEKWKKQLIVHLRGIRSRSGLNEILSSEILISRRTSAVLASVVQSHNFAWSEIYPCTLLKPVPIHRRRDTLISDVVRSRDISNALGKSRWRSRFFGRTELLRL